MKRGPFGGSLTHSYWFVRLESGLPHWGGEATERRQWREARPYLTDLLTRAGYSTSRDFRFPDRDATAKAKARQEAEDYATLVYGHTGVRLAITEGCYA